MLFERISLVKALTMLWHLLYLVLLSNKIKWPPKHKKLLLKVDRTAEL